MQKIIKYETLFQPIKEQITSYYNIKKSAYKDLNFESAIQRWFRDEFDAWIESNIKESGRRLAKDRRKQSANISQERRNTARRKTQKRKSFRLNIELPIKIAETVQELKGKHSNIGEILATTENISESGLYFKSKTQLKVSSIIKVILDFSKVDEVLKNVEANAMVIRVIPLTSGEYGVSLMFSKIEDLDTANLNYLIFKYLAFQKSNLYSLFFY